MGSLSATLRNAANALEVFSRSLSTIGNNIANASTPGYVKQDQTLSPQPFDPAAHLPGGVMAGPLISARAEYLEQAVRSQTELLGNAQQRFSDLGQVEPTFDLTTDSGIAGSLNQFFNSFSQLSVNPNDAANRQAVILQAGRLSQSVRSSAIAISQVEVNVISQTGSVADHINRIADQIAAINRQNRSGSPDAGIDAQLHVALENLSELSDYTVLKGNDGAYSVYLGGQTPLVLGNTVYGISIDASGSQTVVRDAQGADITANISRGRLGALIEERNITLPGYLDDLNTLAKSLADAVNGQLAQGLDQSGNPPAVNLFSYGQASNAALTLGVTGIAPDQIAAAAAGAPGGNGNAIAIAQLATVPAIAGFTFTQFYGALGARVGNDIAGTQQDQSQAQAQVAQARLQRANQSSVSLNEEAAKLLQFQQAYQAAGKLVGVLDTLTQTVLDMVR